MARRLQRGHLRLGHLPRHDHARHVCCALLPAPKPQTCSLSPARLHTPRSPAASRLPARSPPRSRELCLQPSAGSDGLQPAAALGHLPGRGHGQHVLRALPPLAPCFAARCSPRPTPAIAVSRPLHCAHAACTPRSRPYARGRRHTRVAPHTPHALLCTSRQFARAFNQPLSWDTSSVTDTDSMFEVRASLRALAPNLQSRALSPARSPPRTVCPACDPRQGATAFNQPLGWDTSSVTNMYGMFDVRCAPRAPPPHLQSQPCPLCTHRALSVSRRLPPASRPAARRAPRVPCLRPSAGRDRLQPAPELGHVPRQTHALHVFRALPPAPRPLPAPPISAVAPSPLHVACTAIAPLHPLRRLVRLTSYPARPLCDSAARTLPVGRQ